ncbi:hypothetical protein [Desulfitobacterium sp. PCE1]|uniref:hypothetical protein n=1 Tax=Desulfitobacterium sp. PCE1 TaxID=146907 RepID=UPI000380F4B2|nr:hypothetical protein [Desulfitobacterium sp. PCE1]
MSLSSYEGLHVQRIMVPTPMRNGPNLLNTVLMNMAVNEAIVTARSPYNNFRQGIAGKIGSGMIEGWVWDADMRVVRNQDTKAITRVALTAWANISRTSTAGPDIPKGVALVAEGDPYDSNYATALCAFDQGSMVQIRGYYYPSLGYDASFVSRKCYVNTNWAQGNEAMYYVQLRNY